MRAAKHNFAEWSVYAVVLGTLLAWRVWRPRRAAAASA
jgi:sulfoxide reductase heme-binding subunit YedZ